METGKDLARRLVGVPDPLYGPPVTADPELHQLWAKTLAEIRAKYPLTHPVLLGEASRSGVSPEEMQLMIAHYEWIEERRKILNRWAREYKAEEGEPEEED